MSIRFQADADLNQIIVAAVLRRLPEVDFRTASAAGLSGRTDPEVLALAAGEGRILVTHDQTTMPRHFANFIEKAVSSGVLIVPQTLGVRDTVEDLALIWAASREEEWKNRIVCLPL